MRKASVLSSFVLLAYSGLALAQQPTQPAPSQAGHAADQLTPQVLGEMLRSATTFHQLVQNLDLSKSLGPDQHVLGSDGRSHHPLDRTAETIGAGVGAGAAIGAMSHSQNGVLIGALVGGAGGLIVDEIVKHREALKQKAIDGPAPAHTPAP
ncbi:MAG TPA: hypothetical protein VKR43_10355 [Bryobacteraceae bacterium]|nr:hypothetical protein [Bryobacteraceae bacterium]